MDLLTLGSGPKKCWCVGVVGFVFWFSDPKVARARVKRRREPGGDFPEKKAVKKLLFLNEKIASGTFLVSIGCGREHFGGGFRCP